MVFDVEAARRIADRVMNQYLDREASGALRAACDEIERLREVLRDAQPWLMVASDTYEQHYETLTRVHDQVRAALGDLGEVE